MIWQNYLYVEECASDLAELSVCGRCGMPVIWQNCLCQVSVIWQNCLYVDSVSVIWQNCLYVEERASDLAELPVCGGVFQ